MGLTFRLGQLPTSLFTDASNNVGIGAAPSGSYKLEVTGTAKVSSTLLVSGAATFSSTVTANLSGSLFNANNGALSADILTIKGGGGSGAFGFRIEANNGQAIFRTNNFTYNVLMCENGGNVGIGTSSPNAKLSLGNTTSSAKLLLYDGGLTNSGGNGYFAGFAIDSPSANDTTLLAHYQGALVFGRYTNANDTSAITERMRIQSDGLFAFGEYSSTSTGYKFRFNGNGSGDVLAIVLNGGVANSTSYIAFRTGTGNGSYKADIRYETGALSLNNISDVRFKENIIDASTSEQWDKVKNSKLRRFDFKDKTAINQLGFIAQELYQTIPEAISKGGDDEEFNGDEKSIWTLASTNMIPTMFGALQEAITKIEELNERLNKAGL